MTTKLDAALENVACQATERGYFTPIACPIAEAEYQEALEAAKAVVGEMLAQAVILGWFAHRDELTVPSYEPILNEPEEPGPTPSTQP